MRGPQAVLQESQQQSSSLVSQVAELQKQLAEFVERENKRNEELYVKVGLTA